MSGHRFRDYLGVPIAPRDVMVPYQTRTLDRRQVAAQELVSRYLVEDDAAWSKHEDQLRNMIAYRLVKFVLTEHAGKPVHDEVTADLAVRPKWFPRRLWARMPTRRVRWTLDATPEWTYPAASLDVPALGRPVSFVTTNTTRKDVTP